MKIARFVFLAVCVCSVPFRAWGEEFRIGVISALTGDIASIGQAMVNGAQLASETLTSPDLKVTLIAEDDALNPARTVSAFQKLKSSDKVDAIVVFTSGSSKSVSHLAEKAKLPMIAMATDPTIQVGKNYVYNFWITPESQVSALLKELKERGLKKAAAISTIQDGVLAFRDVFRREAQGILEITLDEEIAPKDNDFKGFIAKLRGRPDTEVVLTTLMPGHLGAFAKQLRSSGLTIPIIGPETVESESDIKVAAGGLTGALYATAASPTEDFLKRYKERFGDAAWFSSNNGYDAVAMLVRGRMKGKDADTIVHEISQIKDFPGASGIFSVTEDKRFSLPAELKVVLSDGTSAPFPKKQ